MEIVAKTDIGKVREKNQDYVQFYQKDDDECLAVLCDGMGGHNAGEIASSLTCEDIIKQYHIHGSFKDEDDIRSWMTSSIVHANQLLQERSQQQKEYDGMGTTVVVALIKDSQLYVSHVGDSRAYLYDYQCLHQLTKDDTLVNALVDSGTISKDDAKFHPQKNILLQAVGVTQPLRISFLSIELKDDYVLLCSDGLYNSLSDEQIQTILQQELSLQDIGDQLLTRANTLGGKDNIGFILISNKGVIENEQD
jgi:protein phosphatase